MINLGFLSWNLLVILPIKKTKYQRQGLVLFRANNPQEVRKTKVRGGWGCYNCYCCVWQQKQTLPGRDHLCWSILALYPLFLGSQFFPSHPFGFGSKIDHWDPGTRDSCFSGRKNLAPIDLVKYTAFELIQALPIHNLTKFQWTKG